MRNEAIDQQILQNPDASIVFLGDSITEFWETEGLRLWDEHFAHRSLNLGAAGDQTQHVLERADRLDDLRSPRESSRWSRRSGPACPTRGSSCIARSRERTTLTTMFN